MAAMALVLMASPAWAVPQQINYQGKLTDSVGDPVTTAVSITFSIYNVATGGTALWSSTRTIDPDDDGIYDVILGEVSAINLAFDMPYYLGVTVDTDAEMTPRLELSSVGYAYTAENADSVGGNDMTALDARYVNEGQALSISNAMLQNSSVSSAKVLNNDLTADDLATDSVGSLEIAAGAVGSSEVLDNSLTANDLATDSVTALEIAAGAVASSEVLNDSLTASDLAANSVTASEIAANAVGASEIATGAVASLEVLDNSLTAADLAAGSVGTSEVINGSLLAEDLAGALYDDFVHVTGDTMTGQLSMVTNGSSINVDANPVASTIYGVRVDADQSAANNYYIYGLYSDTDSLASTAYTYGTYSDALGSYVAYGVYGRGESTNSTAYGVYGYGRSNTATAYGAYGSSYAAAGTSYGVRASGSQASSGNNSAVYAFYGSGYAYGTGSLWGGRNYVYHYGTAGTTYGLEALANGSDTGDSYGVKANAYNAVNNYGGSFTSTDSATGSNYGLYAIADNGATNYAGYFEGSQYGVYSDIVSDGSTAYGLYSVVEATTTSSAYGSRSYVTSPAASTGSLRGAYNYANHDGTSGYTYGTQSYAYGSTGSPTYGVYAYGSAPSGSTGSLYGGYNYGYHYGTSGTTYGTASYAYGSDTGTAYGVYGYANYGADNYGGYFRGYGTNGIGIYAYGSSGYAADFYGKVRIRTTTGTTVMELGDGLDYAEGFDVSNTEIVMAGAVLIIDPDNPGKLKLSDAAYDTKVAGIVAGANGLGTGVRLGADRFDKDVALAGRVYCNVDATEMGIQTGDLLTTSSLPGYAMKAGDYSRSQGAILGKAMESIEKGQKGQILVLVTLQ